MTSTIETNSFWNDISSDFELDNYNYNDLSMKEEYEGISSSSPETDHNDSPLLFFSDLVCRVCGAQATGYNFDQITCESCKAFFRRNALRNKLELQCRYTGSCVIDVRTRRLCTYCRLKKCFAVNMRKEWIRTEEEKELRQLQKLAKEQRRLNRLADAQQQPHLNLPIVVRRKKRLLIKPTGQELVPQTETSLFAFHRNLSDEDRIILNNITNAYQSIDEQADHLRRREWTPMLSIVEFLQRENATHRSLIDFYKLIPEFNQLDVQDRVLLIKSNMIKLIHFHCILLFNFQEYPHVGEHMTKWIGLDFHLGMIRTRAYSRRFLSHPLIIKLTLVLFIFSMNLSISYHTDPIADYSNKSTIREIQDFYTGILWRYLNSLYDEREAIRSMDIIVTQILHFQMLMNEMRNAICRQTQRDAINELEISLFRLTW